MLETDKYLPNGDKSIGYPQICIRTNRTAERTDIKPVIEKAISIGKQSPFSQPYNIIKAVFSEMAKDFGSGGFGHAWVIYFNSEKMVTIRLMLFMTDLVL